MPMQEAKGCDEDWAKSKSLEKKYLMETMQSILALLLLWECNRISVEAFRSAGSQTPSSSLSALRSRNKWTPTIGGEHHRHHNSLNYLQSTVLNQQSCTSSETPTANRRPYKKSQNASYPQNRKRRRKYEGRGRGKNYNGNSIASHSRSILNSFEEICQQEKNKKSRNHYSSSIKGKEDFVDLLNSMVQDLLLDGNKTALSITTDTAEAESNNNGNQQQKINLSHHIVPRDASSLIRLLGRNGAYDAMLQFCRRYCRDIMNNASSSKNAKDQRSSSSSRNMISQSDAEEAILFAYTAAIAACSKPPVAGSSSTKKILQQQTKQQIIEYRSKSFLLSLLNEMEHDYTTTNEDDGEGPGSTIRPNSYTLSAILLGVDDTTEALQLLDEFEDRYGNKGSTTADGDNDGDDVHNNNIVAVQVYNVVVASCSKRSDKEGGGWQRALSLLQKMRRVGPEPNEQTYSYILQACAESGQMKVAMSLVDEIRHRSSASATAVSTPSAKLYIPLLKVCAKNGSYQVASSLINIMKEDSLEVSTESMNLYLASLAKGKMHVRALGVLREMIGSNSTAIPDIVSLNTVLSACANADDYESAYALLEQMKDGMFAVPTTTSTNGQQQGSRKTNRRMVEIKPDVVSYNSVISCADPESALALIQEMRLTRRNREGVILPNAITYVNAITQCRKACLQQQQEQQNDDDVDYSSSSSAFEIAMYLLDLAREEGIDLNVFVYSASIWMAESVGDYQTAVQLLREMKCPPNSVCYDGVISCLSQRQHGLHREALYLYYEMQQLGLLASRKTYQRLVYALDNASDPEVRQSSQRKAALLQGVLSAMKERDRNIQVGGPVFEALIRYHGNATDPSTAYRAARMAYDSIIGPVDDACLAGMLRVCSTASPVRWNEALMLIHSSDIVNRAYGPGLVSRRALSNAVICCAKADKWEEAINLIELYGHDDSDARTSAHSGVVSVPAMNSVIRACGRGGRADVAVQLLNDMPIKYGILPDEVSYRLAIIACNQAEHRERRRNDDTSHESTGFELKWWECALSLLRRMREDNIDPSLQTFSSAISACEAAGQWQRAIGVLQSMPAFSSLGNDEDNDVDSPEPANLFCLNAAMAACEKGGAWVEALQLYECIRSSRVQPNFITVNSLLIALENADQQVLAESIYRDALRNKIVSPWKRRYDNDGKIRLMMDLHRFSAPMAKIAIRSFMESLLSPRRRKIRNADAVFIVGKGKRSEVRPVLMPTILQLFLDEFDIEATVDEENAGRIRVSKETLEHFVESNTWKYEAWTELST